MGKQLHSKLSKKKGLSAIITTMILIALSLAAVVMVWSFVSSMIKGQIKNSESCQGNYDKVTLNDQYTCYEAAGNGNYYLRFSISVGTVRPEKVIVAIAAANAVKSYEITNTTGLVSGLTMYPSNSTSIVLPDKNGGLTYRTDLVSSPGAFDSIKIAPVFNGVQCDMSDSIVEISDCALFV
jgi:hypothetical protein